MKPVKTYERLSEEDHLMSFAMARMEDIYEQRKGKVDEPHRHDYYTVLVVNEAEGVHKIDFTDYALHDRQIYFVSPGQVHQVIENKKSHGFVMTFTTEFLMHNSIPLSFISDLNLFHRYGQTPPLLLDLSVFNKILNFCSEILAIYQGHQRRRLMSIGAYMKLLLIECSNNCNQEAIALDQSKVHVLRRFKSEVERHYNREHSTSFYAQQLHLSPDYLSRSIKASLGKTAKEYIQSRLLIEAKRLLYFTELTIKEIGYQLGFVEPSNFSAFFKKCAQLSPSEFRNKMKRPEMD